MLSLRSVAALEPHFRLGSGEPQHQYVPRWKKGANGGSISGNNNNYSISLSLTVENCKTSTSHFPSGMEEVMYFFKGRFSGLPTGTCAWRVIPTHHGDVRTRPPEPGQ